MKSLALSSAAMVRISSRQRHFHAEDCGASIDPEAVGQGIHGLGETAAITNRPAGHPEFLAEAVGQPLLAKVKVGPRAASGHLGVEPHADQMP
jgi:hypothetical protein